MPGELVGSPHCADPTLITTLYAPLVPTVQHNLPHYDMSSHRGAFHGYLTFR